MITKQESRQIVFTSLLTSAILGAVSYGLFKYYYDKYGAPLESKLSYLSPLLSGPLPKGYVTERK